MDRKTEELKKSQEKLIHAERLAAVGSMASHVSHEIKNPLIAIGGLAHQVKRSPNLNDREKEKLDLIINEIGRLENMLIEVRDFTRPTTPRKIKGAINPLIQDILALMLPVFTDQKIETRLDLDPHLPEFDFDPEQLKQVLLNLIKNAAEAMTPAGELSHQDLSPGRRTVLHRDLGYRPGDRFGASSPSLPALLYHQEKRAPAWAWRFPIKSSTITTGISGSPRNPTKGRGWSSSFPCGAKREGAIQRLNGMIIFVLNLPARWAPMKHENLG